MKRENKTSNSLGRQAVVVGGGMAGLMTARVLSEHFDRVVVLERNHNDLANGFSGARSGVPQGRHIHLFLVRGMRILNDLFPGLSDELVGGGASLVDLASDMLWYKNHKAKPRTPSGLHTVIATRPLVEEHVRGRVAEMPNVEMKFGCKVLGLKYEAGAVTGVRYESESDSNRELCADLTVVTAGQLSLAEGWLTELGYGQAPRSEVVSDLSYTSTFVSLPKEPDWKFAVCECDPLRETRQASIARVEDGRYIVAMIGCFEKNPPRNREEILKFARSLNTPHIYEALRDATFDDKITTFRRRASVLRHFEKLPAWPDGLMALGDAVACFNPIYAQGVSAAAIQVELLRNYLDNIEDSGPSAIEANQFQRKVARVIATAWDLSTAQDLRMPAVEGRRTLATRLSHWYQRIVYAAAFENVRIHQQMLRVLNMLDSPMTLASPKILVELLKTRLARLFKGRPVEQPSAYTSLPTLRSDATTLNAG